MSHILLIDDDEDVLKLTTRWLQKAGYEVSSAASGQEALDLLKSLKPDLILLDYAMPQMDGPQVLRAIREDQALDGVPVLFRTGKEESVAEETEGLSYQGMVSKAEGKLPLMKAVEDILK